jgi:hypothetical protein
MRHDIRASKEPRAKRVFERSKRLSEPAYAVRLLVDALFTFGDQQHGGLAK